MTQGPQVTAHTGPIRCQGPIKVRALMAPVTVKVRGTPGPAGPRGLKGDMGDQGPAGNLDAGIVIDGGNF
ncbi:hypothetical protein [Aestuariivirga sp.]|uniref:hypothetical protein n=1 Tax=Aestuariivirga sp. TaxID=2650926 RepID=UPI00378463CD